MAAPALNATSANQRHAGSSKAGPLPLAASAAALGALEACPRQEGAPLLQNRIAAEHRLHRPAASTHLMGETHFLVAPRARSRGRGPRLGWPPATEPVSQRRPEPAPGRSLVFLLVAAQQQPSTRPLRQSEAEQARHARRGVQNVPSRAAGSRRAPLGVGAGLRRGRRPSRNRSRTPAGGGAAGHGRGHSTARARVPRPTGAPRDKAERSGKRGLRGQAYNYTACSQRAGGRSSAARCRPRGGALLAAAGAGRGTSGQGPKTSAPRHRTEQATSGVSPSPSFANHWLDGGGLAPPRPRMWWHASLVRPCARRSGGAGACKVRRCRCLRPGGPTRAPAPALLVVVGWIGRHATLPVPGLPAQKAPSWRSGGGRRGDRTSSGGHRTWWRVSQTRTSRRYGPDAEQASSKAKQIGFGQTPSEYLAQFLEEAFVRNLAVDTRWIRHGCRGNGNQSKAIGFCSEQRPLLLAPYKPMSTLGSLYVHAARRLVLHEGMEISHHQPNQWVLRRAGACIFAVYRRSGTGGTRGFGDRSSTTCPVKG
jgi:hypothetical protein